MNLIRFILDGGVMMYPLIFCSIIMVAVILERRRSLEEASIEVGPLRDKIREMLRRGVVDEALDEVKKERGPVARILEAGLHRYKLLKEAGREGADLEEGTVKAMEDYSPHAIASLEKNLGALATIGNLGPLIGFLGTVMGMIKSFNAIVLHGMAAEHVAEGISEALTTTVAGLIVAIPATLAYNYFTTRVQSFVLEIQESSTHLIETISTERRVD